MRALLLAVFAVLALAFAGSPGGAPREPLKKTPVDESIDKALSFLANMQSKSEGYWTAGARGRDVAVTSLCVMAFLSAGHVPGEGKYGKTIESGVRWVLTQQQPNGLLANQNAYEMYHHGIATLMLAEVAGMVDRELGKEVRKAVEKAVLLILKAQRTQGTARGGWRYRVQHFDGADISVTGWQVMALRAARNLGCDVPAEHIHRAIDYIKRCQHPGTGGFRYHPGAGVTVACTGTSVLALELCGKDQHKSPAVLKGAAYLVRTDNLPRWNVPDRFPHFFYSVYYGAQASFQVGGNYWSAYRARLHFLLQRHQGDTGYWLHPHRYDSTFGPNYCTAMGVLALTVEYRFLPIYQRGEEP